jgi:hypothetical protein
MTGAINIDILEKRILGFVHDHRPELRLNESQILKYTIGGILNREIDRSTEHVRSSFREIVPI